jgi:hypothetical protein
MIRVNVQDAVCAFAREIVSGRADPPDIILLIETDATPMCGSVLKEGRFLGDAIPGLSESRVLRAGAGMTNTRSVSLPNYSPPSGVCFLRFSGAAKRFTGGLRDHTDVPATVLA